MITKEELAQAMLELKESQQSFRESLKELQRESQRESQESLRKSEESLRKSEESFRKSQQELREAQKQTDAQIKETSEEVKRTSEQMKATDETLKRMGIKLGGISNNQGDVAEEFFYNSISANPTIGGVTYDFTDKNITRRKGAIEDEFDIVLVNGNDIAIIETKYKAHQKDLERLIHKKYENFKKLYPEYSGYKHHLGLASFYFNDALKEEALSKNVMVLQRKGDVVETILP
jgi:hypothetical protein